MPRLSAVQDISDNKKASELAPDGTLRQIDTELARCLTSVRVAAELWTVLEGALAEIALAMGCDARRQTLRASGPRPLASAVFGALLAVYAGVGAYSLPSDGHNMWYNIPESSPEN